MKLLKTESWEKGENEMSSDVKTQVVWLPDGFGGGGHAAVCRASDYAALADELATLRAEVQRLRAQSAWVPDGYAIVPAEPTPEMAAQTAYDGTQYSNPFDFDDFRKDYAAMLAAAPSPARKQGF